MRILLVGSGGREHAIAQQLKKSKTLTQLFVLGNENHFISALSDKIINNKNSEGYATLISDCLKEKIDLVIIGPEAPLAEGMSDALRGAGILVFGPSSKGAKLESSKVYFKDFCQKYKVKVAPSVAFDDFDKAIKYIDERASGSMVIKVDGLAQGKGVVVAQNKKEAKEAVKASLIDHKFGKAGNKILIEDCLEGKEASLFIMFNNNGWEYFASARDYKQAFDNNKGPNTGGMGCVTPVDYLDKKTFKQAFDDIVIPFADGIKKEKIDYRGIIFFGLMLTKSGAHLLEVNCRFGDPECQTILPLYSGDFCNLCRIVASDEKIPQIDMLDKASVTVVLAKKGYPNKTDSAVIPEFEKVFNNWQKKENCQIFTAGVKKNSNDSYYSKGGRIINFVAQGNSIDAARKLAYQGIEELNWQEGFYRKDIGIN